MKKILTISFAALLVSAAAFSDAPANSKSKKHYAKAAPKPAVEAKAKPEASDSERAESGFYVGAGLGWFHAAKEFDAHEPKDAAGSYAKKKPSAHPAVVPNVLVGYRFNNYLSADVNAQYRTFKYSADRIIEDDTLKQHLDQKIKNYSVFVNGNAGVPIGAMFTPYVTAGVGCAYNKVGKLNSSFVDTSNGIPQPLMGSESPGKNTNNFAWNAGAGVKVQINKSFDLDLGYKYIDLGKVKIEETSLIGDSNTKVFSASQKLRVHQVMLNLIYNL